MPRSRAAGFSLIELMIAMVLGLIVIAGVTSVFLAGQQSFRTNNALADVQDSSRVAFELMARDIREAGLTGCNSSNDRIANLLSNQATDGWANWGIAIRGYDNAPDDPAVKGLSSPNAVANTHSLQLVGAGIDPGATAQLYDDATSGNQIALATPAPTFSAGDVVLLCTAGHAALFQISGYASGTVSFSGSGNPGNDSTYLGYPLGSICSQNPPPPGGDAKVVYCFPANSLLSKLRAVDWYIGTNDDNGTSLYRVSVENNGGVATPTRQEMVRDVTDMQVAYVNPANDGQFYPASSATIATMG
ncbi:MAG: prepilin-type N-terminal cleavage/methylation domain-containing protein, partial [Rhodanobacteraceae bacterium]